MEETQAIAEDTSKIAEQQKAKEAQASSFKPDGPYITRGEAAKSRKPGLRAQKVLICYNASWWNDCSKSWRISRMEASQHSVASALTIITNPSSQFHFLNDEDRKPKRRCVFASSTPPALQSMIKATPKNSTVRAMIMNHFGEMPPSDVTTFDGIKDWIEFNFPKGGGATLDSVSMSFRKSYDLRGLINRVRYFDGNGAVTLSSVEIQEIVNKVVSSGGRVNDVFDHIKNTRLAGINVRCREFDSSMSNAGEEVQSDALLQLNYGPTEKRIIMEMAMSVLSEEEFDKFSTEPDEPEEPEEEDAEENEEYGEGNDEDSN